MLLSAGKRQHFARSEDHFRTITANLCRSEVSKLVKLQE